MFSFVFGVIVSLLVLIFSKDKFVCIKLMKMRVRDYVILIIFCEYIWGGVCFLFVLIIVSKILGGIIF